MRKPNINSSLIVAKLKNKKVIFVIFLVLTAVILLMVWKIYSSPNSQATRKLDKIDYQDVSCEKVRNEVGGLKVDNRYSIDIQKKILEKQLTCFSDDLQFDKAIASAEQLKVVYSKNHEVNKSLEIDAKIKAMQALRDDLKALDSN